MGGEILKGCEGGLRIAFVVLLFFGGIFSCFIFGYGAMGYYGEGWVSISTYLAFVLLVSFCIWYLLILVDVVKYTPEMQKIDGMLHLICGIVYAVITILLFVIWMIWFLVKYSQMLGAVFEQGYMECFLFGMGLLIAAGVVCLCLGLRLRKGTGGAPPPAQQPPPPAGQRA